MTKTVGANEIAPAALPRPKGVRTNARTTFQGHGSFRSLSGRGLVHRKSLRQTLKRNTDRLSPKTRPYRVLLAWKLAVIQRKSGFENCARGFVQSRPRA